MKHIVAEQQNVSPSFLSPGAAPRFDAKDRQLIDSYLQARAMVEKLANSALDYRRNAISVSRIDKLLSITHQAESLLLALRNKLEFAEKDAETNVEIGLGDHGGLSVVRGR